MHRAVVLDFHPRLGRFVEKRERQLGDAVEHVHQPTLERAPECFLLAILVGAVGEGRGVLDPQIEEALLAFAETEAWGTSIGSADFYGWSGIAPATDAEYDMVRAMVAATGYEAPK